MPRAPDTRLPLARSIEPGFTDPAKIAAWQAHLDAGRIGNNPAPDPAIVAHRLALAAQFARYARDARILAYRGGAA